MDVGAPQVEGMGLDNLRYFATSASNFFLGATLVFLSSCTARFLKHQKEGEVQRIEEFSSRVVIEETPDQTAPSERTSNARLGLEEEQLTKASASKVIRERRQGRRAGQPPRSSKKTVKGAATSEVWVRQPELEGTEGFAPGERRPRVDPFRPGERVIHEVSYFAMIAGELALEVRPFVRVNQRKHYQFYIGVKSSPFFSRFYRVDDYVLSYLDFERMIPSVYTLHVKESGQIREARFLYDHQSQKISFWERKVTKKSDVEERKIEWEALPFSQDVFSGIFYLRVFPWKVGDERAFRVAHDNENLIFRGKALRREKIVTPAGDFFTIVIQPSIELEGIFKPMGDILIWLSDDNRKYILKIESKIRIGTLRTQVVSIEPGSEPKN
jgi:hypothetical protein